MYLFNVLIGDCSGDGHEKYESSMVYSSISSKQFFEDYKKGSEKLGFDLINDFCVEYEENTIEKEFYDKLIEAGCPDEYFENHGTDEYPEFHPIDWNEIVFFIVKLGSEDNVILYTLKGESIDIGGYGLFY